MDNFLSSECSVYCCAVPKIKTLGVLFQPGDDHVLGKPGVHHCNHAVNRKSGRRASIPL